MNTSDPRDCFTAQTILGYSENSEVNPDVGGAAVAASNIVINLVLPILLQWSQEPEDVNTTVVMLLTQVYPIMIATAASINTDNLTLFDAHFAVAVTASPVSVYLAYSSFRDSIGRPNTLFRHLGPGPGKKIIRFLGLALPVLWLVVNLLITFLPHGFKDSHRYCKGVTFAYWFEFQAVSNFVGVLDIMGMRDMWNDLQGRGGLGALSLTAMWVWAVYLVRHRYEIWSSICFRRTQQRDGNHKFVTRIWLSVYNIPAASWFVITQSHPWMVFVIVLCLHWSWILGIAKGMQSNGAYQLSYGQIMSLFSAVPPLLSALRLLLLSWRDLYEFATSLPKSFCEGAWFLTTGSPDFWGNHSAQRAPPASHPDLPWERLRLFVTYTVWLVATCLHVMWIFEYVKAGSMPNPRRRRINNPHAAWKPFSITMYIHGYCVSLVNILVWSTFYNNEHHVTNEKAGAWLIGCWGFLSARQQYLLRSLKLMMVPFAFIMCTAPLFSPFAALPLAQEWQWSHFCDSFDGEVILTGAVHPWQVSTASFYLPIDEEPYTRVFNYNYTFVNDPTGAQIFSFNSSSPLKSQPGIVGVSYNGTSKSFNASCLHQSGSSSTPGTCAYGRYATEPYLSFSIFDSRVGTNTSLRAFDKEWRYSDDAPGVVIRFEQANGELGDIAIQSAVTRRNHCQVLKLCLPSRTLTLAQLVPLGMILSAQEEYAKYCSQPRIYTL